jgi:hypothetical protein
MMINTIALTIPITGPAIVFPITIIVDETGAATEDAAKVFLEFGERQKRLKYCQ